jgi:hypothetical protein
MRHGDAETDIGLVLDIVMDKRGVTEYAYRLSRISPEGLTSILTDIDGNREAYREQASRDAGLADPALLRREWKKVCGEYLRDRRYMLSRALRSGDLRTFLRLIRDLGRRENRRWLCGLIGR